MFIKDKIQLNTGVFIKDKIQLNTGVFIKDKKTINFILLSYFIPFSFISTVVFIFSNTIKTTFYFDFDFVKV